MRGFEQDLLTEFEPEESVTYDALIFCDMTTGPDGKAISSSIVSERSTRDTVKVIYHEPCAWLNRV